MVKPITLFTSSAGLNTRLDPQRLQAGYDNETGVSEFSQAVNVSIDDRGLVELRTGSSEASVGDFHSLFCDGGDCFVIQERTTDAALMRVASLSPFTLVGVRSGLTKNQPMSLCQVNSTTLYGNGVEYGQISSGVSSAWSVDAYNGPDTTLTFLPSVPVPTVLGYDGAGVVGLASGQNLYWNRYPFLLGLFAKRDVITLPGAISMVKAVDGGWYVSDDKYVRFFKNPLDDTSELQVTDFPATGVAGQLVDAMRLGLDIPGYGCIFSSTDGVWFGSSSGITVNLTREKVDYPADQNQGACLVHKNKQIIHTVY